MESILKKLEGMERIAKQNIPHETKLEPWEGNIKSSDYKEGDSIISTNVEIKTSLTVESHEYVADGDHQVSYNAGVTDESKLLPTHEKQLTQALQRFDGWRTMVRVEPAIRRHFNPDTGREEITIRTRLITADTREVTP